MPPKPVSPGDPWNFDNQPRLTLPWLPELDNYNNFHSQYSIESHNSRRSLHNPPQASSQTLHYPSLRGHEATNWTHGAASPHTMTPYGPDHQGHPGWGRNTVEDDLFSRRRAPSVDSLPDTSDIFDMSWYQGPLARDPPSDIESALQTSGGTITISDDDSGESEVAIVPAKRTRTRRSGRPKKAAAAGSDGVDEFNDQDSVAPSKRPCGRPRKAKSDTAPPITSAPSTTAAENIDKETDDSIFTFELLVHLMLPDKVIPGKTKRAKSKTEKQDPEPRRPIFVQSDKTWDEFLVLVSSLVPTLVSGLFVSSFMWHFLSPANSPWLPVTTPEGFQSMLGQLKKKLLKGEAYVVIRMRKPVEVISEPRMISSTNIMKSVIDENESSDDDRPVSKMGKIDERVEEKAEELLELYGPGKCDLHPTLPCFHFRPTDLHFELSRARRLVWAQAILCGTVDKTQIPLTSKLFKKDQALKASGSRNDTVPATGIPPTSGPAVQAPFPMTPVHPVGYPGATMYPQYPMLMLHSPYPMPAYPFGPMVPPGPWSFANVSSLASPTSPHQRSSPPLPPDGYTLADFCADYELDEDIEAGLIKLGFKPGARLTDITSDDFLQAGIKPVQCSQVMRAYNKYKTSRRC
ncbi:hypothetical protein EV360DRAFT_90329 [Lentinula raphanica]|nr:hypothetical protein EV360DRAFT_90329 [Lentinula raphanica]